MINYSQLDNTNRILFEVDLKPVQGHRIQPTGFPNLGAATYRLPESGRSMLIVESNQSMANRLEDVMWDYANSKIVPELEGLPYVEVVNNTTNAVATSSLLESHRLASPYILEGDDKSLYNVFEEASKDIIENDMPIDLRAFAKLVFKYDPNSIIHGVFIANDKLAGGRLRLQRLLSGFIEAEDVETAESGGVKLDRLNPKGAAAQKFGHVPFHRTEYVANQITAYFNFDIACLKSYGLDESAEKLLLSLAFWKVRRFIEMGLRLRTACDLDAEKIRVTKPVDFEIPSEEVLVDEIQKYIKECSNKGLFAEPSVTQITWTVKK